MDEWLKRTELLLGTAALEKLKKMRIAVLGLGGVGGAAAEALCRAGVGHLLLVDSDKVEETNLNRQIIATRQTIGQNKAEACKARLLSIHPRADIEIAVRFYLPDCRDFLFAYKPDFVIDAIDTVTAKLDLAEQCTGRHISLISCLGTGNRLDPGKLRLGDLAQTVGCGCPLARVMRRELKKRGISSLPVLFSTELPLRATVSEVPEAEHGRHSPGSISFVPPAAGYLIASYVVRTALTSKQKTEE